MHGRHSHEGKEEDCYCMHCGGMWHSAWWGAFAVLLGAWWLLGELGYVTFEWKWAGPLALIIFGLSMVTRHFRWMRRPMEPAGKV